MVETNIQNKDSIFHVFQIYLCILSTKHVDTLSNTTCLRVLLHGDIDLKTLRIHINKLGCVHPSKTCLKEFNVTLKLQRAQLHG